MALKSVHAGHRNLLAVAALAAECGGLKHYRPPAC